MSRARGWILQLGLTLVPAGLAAALFLVGFRNYVDAAVAPGDALEVDVTADGWHWHAAYAGGNVSDDSVRVPVGRPVHVTVHSPARIHRFDVPGLHVGTEAGPNADGSLWLLASAPGEQLVACGPACGGHPEMLTTLRALDEAAWSDWQDPGAHLAPADYGKLLYEKSMCKTCHSLDGTPGTAPSFRGVFGKHEALADGSMVLVDEAYVRESILTPSAKVVKGFQPVMPPFAGQLGDKQIEALIAFLKTVKP